MKRNVQEFNYERRGNTHTHTPRTHPTHTHTDHLAAVGLVSSSQSHSSCLLDNDHTCVQVCGAAHMGLGGGERGVSYNNRYRVCGTHPVPSRVMIGRESVRVVNGGGL